MVRRCADEGGTVSNLTWLEEFSTFVDSLSSCKDHQALVKGIPEMCFAAFGYKHTCLYTPEANARYWRLSSEHGCAAFFPDAASRFVGNVVTYRFSNATGRMSLILGSHEPVVMDFARTVEGDVPSTFLVDFGITGGVGVPLYTDVSTEGLLAVLYGDADVVEGPELRFLGFLGRFLGTVLHQARHMRSFETTSLLAECLAMESELRQNLQSLALATEHAASRKQSEAAALAALCKNPGDSLTQNEIEVIKLASEGLSNQEIGNVLSISESAVKKRFGTIMDKTQLKNRTQIVVHAARAGLLD